MLQNFRIACQLPYGGVIVVKHLLTESEIVVLGGSDYVQ